MYDFDVKNMRTREFCGRIDSDLVDKFHFFMGFITF